MKIYQVDAFTDQPFKGNPAGVCILDIIHPDAWMLSLAAEMNLSETAFLLKQETGFSLRWFTPKREVSLCGHATLASAHILWEENYLKPEDEACFDTQSGMLTAKKDGDWIEMDFPARVAVDTETNPVLNRALNIVPIHSAKFSLPKGDVYLLEIGSEEELGEMRPDFALLLAISGVRSVIVTSRSRSPEYDFISRYFAPAIGVNEDPVTGSAHCYLAPYWESKLDKRTLLGFQASERSGVVGCTWNDKRVLLRGKAVTVFKGELLI
jgi:PhzF family phenazine biosynthesis protein